MARKSRKVNGNIVKNNEKNNEKTVYNTAIYVRLSAQDKNNNDTLENQENLIRRYIEEREEFKIVGIYRDNGETGTNFKRPEFERMMEDIRNNKINCLIVKDLSRLGRDSILVGEYIQDIFPFLGVRFIACTDNYDSKNVDTSDEIIMHLKNLTNEIYAKDISRKVAPIIKTKQEKGEYLGSFPPYGYRKSLCKKKLVVDNDVVYVIQKIFALRGEGESYVRIIKWLNENNIDNPSKYRLKKGIVKNKKYENTRWTINTVKNILKNEVYLGHTIQGLSYKSLYKGKKREKIPKEDWKIVRNTHESIITQEIFDNAQKIIELRREEHLNLVDKYKDIELEENIFMGKIYCGICGRKLHRKNNITVNNDNITKIYSHYVCQTHMTDKNSCSLTSISHEKIKNIIYIILRQEFSLRDKFVRNNEMRKNNHELARIDDINDEINKLESNKIRLYDKYLEECIAKEEYLRGIKEFESRKAILNLKLQVLRENNLDCDFKFEEISDLTGKITENFVENIVIFSKNNVVIKFKSLLY